jgi:hypothetical protein
MHGQAGLQKPRANNSPLKNGLKRHRDVVPNFAGSERAKKIVRLAEVPLANRPLKKPGMAFSTA